MRVLHTAPQEEWVVTRFLFIFKDTGVSTGAKASALARQVKL